MLVKFKFKYIQVGSRRLSVSYDVHFFSLAVYDSQDESPTSKSSIVTSISILNSVFLHFALMLFVALFSEFVFQKLFFPCFIFNVLFWGKLFSVTIYGLGKGFLRIRVCRYDYRRDNMKCPA